MIRTIVHRRKKDRRPSWCALLLAAGPLLLGALAGCSTEPPAETLEPTAQVSEPPVEGELLYRRHCSACHGTGGEGDGPVAESLSPPPPDLTRMAAQNNAQYPLRQIMRAIDGEKTIRAHGDSDMPVWGAIFVQELQNAPHTQRTTLLHVRAIAEYIGTLQQP